MRHPAFLSALALALLPLLGTLAACQARPGLDLAAGWRSTDSMTGPAVSVGAGEWHAAEPFDGESLDATSCVGGACRAPAAPSPELVGKLAELEAAAAKSREALATLDARVAAGTLSADQATALREAAAAAERAETRARGAIAEAAAAAATADAAKRRAEAPPPPPPTDWTPPGILAAGVGLLGWYLRRRSSRDAADAVALTRAEAEARARELAREAVDAYDRAPYTPADAAAMKAAGDGKLGLVT